MPTPTFVVNPDISGTSADVLVVGIREGGRLPSALLQLDPSATGWFQGLIDAGQIRGKQGELTLIASPSGSGISVILVVGLGSGEDSRSLAIESASAAIRHLSDRPRGHVMIALAESFLESIHDGVVLGTLLGCHGQGLYQTDPSLKPIQRISFVGMSQSAMTRGIILGESINTTRRLVNEPPSVVYPETFVEMASEIVSDTEIEVEIWDQDRLAEENCRSILAVGAGSSRPPRLLIMRYRGGGTQSPLAIVGKGVTFDSGGLSLKPSEAMVDMKCDMAGAATVVGVMRAIAKLGVQQNVIGFCGLAENMVSGSSYKLGDVIKTRSGKTIEILNTDAEGRVVLADTLDVALENEPRAMVDLATLTGACMVALGTDVAGLMTNHQELCDQITASARIEGEPVWQLPMFSLYDEKIKSKVADIKNVGQGRWGGAITAAKFLENFVGNVPWVHMDIAGPSFADSPKSHRDAGATGVMVRTLVNWIESQGD